MWVFEFGVGKILPLNKALEGYLLLEPDMAKDSIAEATVLMKCLDWVEAELDS